MSKINILPSQVYNRIAAGEVVDRPASVVKELVENSIDAGATEIEIYIEGGGKQLLRVVDNGSGISRDDLHAAFLPHATSKISTAADLENVLTLGFRGEAVASIASVSKMTITSIVKGADGYSLCSDGGKIGNIVAAAISCGTDVSVENIFFNTPVRFKFMKSDKSEEGEILSCAARFILSKPNISFKVYTDNKLVLQSFGGGDEEALADVYGASTVKNCFHISAEKHGIKIRGYIGNRNFYKANKTYQNVFLNGRYIVNQTISTAVNNAYLSYLMKRQYPFYVLHIEVPTEIVDVNVHPNKADVRFADNKIIFGCIYNVIAAVLDGSPAAITYLVDSQNAVEEPKELEKNEEEKTTPIFSYEDAKREIEKAAPVFVEQKKAEKTQTIINVGVPKKEVNPSFDTPIIEKDSSKEVLPKEELPKKKLDLPFDVPPTEKKDFSFKADECIERMAKQEAKEKTEKVDNHYFEQYLKKNEEETKQNVVIEEKKNTPKAEIDYFEENKKFLIDLEKKKAQQDRIEINTCRFVGKLFNTYLLYERNEDFFIIDQHAAHERLIFNKLKARMEKREVVSQPMLFAYVLEVNNTESAFLRENLDNIRALGFDIDEFGGNSFKISAVPADLQDVDLKGFFDEILGDINGYKGIRLSTIFQDKLATAACKAAVKGGMDLSQGEIDELFKLIGGDMTLKCPHGRPVVVRMTKNELEKMFKRIV